ncbi:N-acetylmuramic acid 6-phosphate etherase [Candidatus Poribacteria bacterium]|nr:N-acetylmuramic acid 6-phosphate etherase [Candidatus Poribacteria bacterium]
MNKQDIAKVITEQRNPNSLGIDSKSTAEIIYIFNQEDRKVLEAVEKEAVNIEKAIGIIVDVFKNSGRLFYVGAGTSGRLGVMDSAECPPTFGTDPNLVQGIIAGGDLALRRAVEGVEDHPEDGAAAIRAHGVTACDVVMGITTSGRTPYVIGAIQEAHRIGAKTIFLSCNPPSETLNQFVDVFITPIVGPEIITGSTRLKAGTATKLALNMLTTIAMIKLGKVYNNLMVDVQTWNTKLVDRAKRIIAEITEVDYDTAGEFLNKANGSAKVAIVMLEGNVDADKAIKLLEENDGFLRNLITEIRHVSDFRQN